jgi:hypothetical protein
MDSRCEFCYKAQDGICSLTGESFPEHCPYNFIDHEQHKLFVDSMIKMVKLYQKTGAEPRHYDIESLIKIAYQIINTII